ncbi:MAG: NADH:ubiquinone reductase (Na(+)-transporting) subunit F [Spirochaetes bacterium]|nr:NADH:ubiquinone reductase (Na(+)-transporting) subunit F [Spirochaetota bacterium]
MLTVISTVIIFASVVFFLTLVIVGAEYKLVKKGNVKLLINKDEEKAMEVEAGSTLLSTLTANGILLPSACGGQGTCGVCKCKVHKGGGDILPTETAHISRKLAKEGTRLACQVKVREDMEIEIPEEVFSVKKWECEVVSNDTVATFIKEFVVKLPEGEKLDFQSGGYIQIEVPKYSIDFSKDIDIPDEYKDDWEKFGIFNLKANNSEEVVRAYSMANHPAEGNIIMLNVRIATPPYSPEKGRFENVPPGIVSSYIFSKKPGDKVTISGPYGEFFIRETEKEMIFIGGGAGMAPMRSHIFHLFHTLKTKRKVSFWYGARSMREVFYEDDFKKIQKEFKNFTFHLALSEPLPEDNWKGPVGFIHQVLFENYLKDHAAPEDCEYYMCGPPLMNSAVNAMLDSLGVESENILYDDFGG